MIFQDRLSVEKNSTKKLQLLGFLAVFYFQMLMGFFTIYMNYIFVTASPNIYQSLNNAFAILIMYEVKDLFSIPYVVWFDTFQQKYKNNE